MAALPVGVLAGVAKAMHDAGKKEDAEAILAKLMPRLNTAQAVSDSLNALMAIGGAEAMLPRLGFVTRWKLVGPFPWLMAEAFNKINVNEPAVDLEAEYPGPEDKPLRWKAQQSLHPMGLMDLMGMICACDHVCAYAYTEITLPEATEAILGCGSDDGIKVWVNEEAVHENNTDRGVVLDQDRAPIKLKAGVNRLLVECTQNGGGWNFLVRLSQADGSPLLITYP